MHVLTSVDETLIARLRQEDHFFWIDLVSPDRSEVEKLGSALDLHPVLGVVPEASTQQVMGDWSVGA